MTELTEEETRFIRKNKATNVFAANVADAAMRYDEKPDPITAKELEEAIISFRSQFPRFVEYISLEDGLHDILARLDAQLATYGLSLVMRQYDGHESMAVVPANVEIGLKVSDPAHLPVYGNVLSVTGEGPDRQLTVEWPDGSITTNRATVFVREKRRV